MSMVFLKVLHLDSGLLVKILKSRNSLNPANIVETFCSDILFKKKRILITTLCYSTKFNSLGNILNALAKMEPSKMCQFMCEMKKGKKTKVNA